MTSKRQVYCKRSKKMGLEDDINMDEALDSEKAMERFLNLIVTEPDIAKFFS